MATVALDRVTKRYTSKKSDVLALDNLSVDIADREFIVLVGPSGCGKTTTLRLVAGLEEVTSGHIRIGERLVNNVAPKDRDIAMVFQNYALYPHMTVFKNMAFGLKMRRVPKVEIKRKVHEVASMLGIEPLLQRKPAALSGGERQRVAVGRAIVRRPQVFLFDEPLSNLDAKLRTHMRTEIKSLHRELQTTVIYVTHDQEEAMTLADRMAIMHRGVIRQCGAPLEVYERPEDRFVAGFVGTPTMNFLGGRLEQDGAAVRFSGATCRLLLSERTASAVGPHHGEPVVLGIRPQHIHVDATATQRAPNGNIPPDGFQASVTVVEPLGDSMNVHLVLKSGETMVARVPPTSALSAGKSAVVRVDVDRVHLFEDGPDGTRLN